jgi:hypothetical protein
MPARDLYHAPVKNALLRDGWTVTHDPYRLSWAETDMYVDLGAERLLAAQKDTRKIAVEIKSFIGPSPTADLEQAMGQFTVYRTVLAKTDPDRVLYLAVRKKTLRDVFEKPLGKLLLESHLVRVIGVDTQEGVIVRWID